MTSIFKDMLKSDETVFRDTVALDYDFVPKLVPFRDMQQKEIASCIKPLFDRRNGRNILVFGPPGIGKTVACKHLFNELENETDDVVPLYINCWENNTSYKIVLELCRLMDYKFTMNKKTDELFKIIKEELNRSSVVFCFDEIDKASDHDFLYFILENIYRRCIVLITNLKEWVVDLDSRIKSRLTPSMLEFAPYNAQEIKGILKERLRYAFSKDAWDTQAFHEAAKKAAEIGDVRIGLHILKEAGHFAEDDSSRNILMKHVQKAIKKIDEFSIKSKDLLDEDTKLVLKIIKVNDGQKIGNLFRLYQEDGGKGVYKSFQRKIKKLQDGKFIKVKRMTGAEGNTSIININTASEKKLTEY